MANSGVKRGLGMTSPFPNLSGSDGYVLTKQRSAEAGMAWKVPSTAPIVVGLTDATSIALNAALGNTFTVTLGGNRTLANPSNPVNGQTITVQVTQPASGGPWTLAFGSAYTFFPAQPTPILSTSGGAVDLLQFTYISALSEWLLTGALIHDMTASTNGPVGLTPGSFGFALATMLNGAGSSTLLTCTGELAFMALVTATETTTISTLGANVHTAGVTAGTGVNLMAIFAGAAGGAQLGVTGDMTTAFESTGKAEGSLGSAVPVVAGKNYYLAVLANFTGTALQLDGASTAFNTFGTLVLTGQSTSHATMPTTVPTLTGESYSAVMWGR